MKSAILADFFMGIQNMNKIYLIMAICALILGAYFYGANIADAKCQIRQITENTQKQTYLINNQRIIHENVYKTGLVDIRRILRDKYTIAE